MKSQNVIVVTIGAMFIFIVAGVVAIVIAVPEGARAASLISILIGMLAPTVATLVTLARVDAIRDAQQQIGVQVHELNNGKGDAKIQRNLHAVLDQRTATTNPTTEEQH